MKQTIKNFIYKIEFLILVLGITLMTIILMHMCVGCVTIRTVVEVQCMDKGTTQSEEDKQTTETDIETTAAQNLKQTIKK